MLVTKTQTNEIVGVIRDMQVEENESVLLLFGEESKVDYSSLITAINALDVSFFGGVFPGIIHGKENFKSGCIIKKLPAACKPIVIQGLESDEFEIPNLMEEYNLKQGSFTLLTFVDGLTANIATYLKKLFHVYGNTTNFLGGGAGSLTLVQQPCVFSNEGLFQDAAILCPINMEVSLGVKHGWQKLKGPIVATRTEKNIIHELNWMNAFEVYKEVVEEDSWKTFNDENFFDIAKGYPFGIIRENGEDIIRDPIAVDKNGSLVCVGEVPENAVLYIMKGKNEALIQSAEVAIQESIANLKKDVQHTLIVDCISRTLFLENEFPKELEAICNAMTISNEESIPQGILSLGEISSSGEGLLEFYNKTLVIGALL